MTERLTNCGQPKLARLTKKNPTQKIKYLTLYVEKKRKEPGRKKRKKNLEEKTKKEPGGKNKKRTVTQR